MHDGMPYGRIQGQGHHLHYPLLQQALADPGSPGKWPLKRRERERERERPAAGKCYCKIHSDHECLREVNIKGRHKGGSRKWGENMDKCGRGGGGEGTEDCLRTSASQQYSSSLQSRQYFAVTKLFHVDMQHYHDLSECGVQSLQQPTASIKRVRQCCN